MTARAVSGIFLLSFAEGHAILTVACPFLTSGPPVKKALTPTFFRTPETLELTHEIKY